MKKYIDIGVYDFSDYAEEITWDALFKINGGAQIENSIEAQANAKVGDTVTREDGTTHTLYKGDIDWAQKEMAKKETKTPASGSSNNTNTGNAGAGNTSGNTGISSPEQNISSSYGKKYREMLEKTEQQFIYDFDNKTINVKIDDRNALKKASEILSDLYVEGYTVNAIDIDGNIRNFESYKTLLRYIQIGDKNVYEDYSIGGELKSYVENNQLKTERYAYLEKKSDYDYYELRGALVDASSSLLENINGKPNYIDGGMKFNMGKFEGVSSFDKTHVEKTVSASLIGLDFNLGRQSARSKFGVTFGASLGVSGGFKYENNIDVFSISLDSTALIGGGVYLEYKK